MLFFNKLPCMYIYICILIYICIFQFYVKQYCPQHKTHIHIIILGLFYAVLYFYIQYCLIEIHQGELLSASCTCGHNHVNKRINRKMEPTSEWRKPMNGPANCMHVHVVTNEAKTSPTAICLSCLQSLCTTCIVIQLLSKDIGHSLACNLLLYVKNGLLGHSYFPYEWTLESVVFDPLHVERYVWTLLVDCCLPGIVCKLVEL